MFSSILTTLTINLCICPIFYMCVIRFVATIEWVEALITAQETVSNFLISFLFGHRFAPTHFSGSCGCLWSWMIRQFKRIGAKYVQIKKIWTERKTQLPSRKKKTFCPEKWWWIIFIVIRTGVALSLACHSEGPGVALYSGGAVFESLNGGFIVNKRLSLWRGVNVNVINFFRFVTTLSFVSIRLSRSCFFPWLFFLLFVWLIFCFDSCIKPP